MITNIMDIGKDFKTLAVDKINIELKEFKGDKYGTAVHTYVANALREFCEKNERFAEVLYKTRRSLSDCIAECMKGCRQAISDIEVYRRVAKFYFPNSEVDFVMTITVGDAPDEKYIGKEPKKTANEKKDSTKASPKADVKKPGKKVEREVIQLSLF